MNDESKFRCLCSGATSVDLFTVGEYIVSRCNRCGQAYVTGINPNTVKAEYDSNQYFTERNSYIKSWNKLARHFQNILNRIKNFKTKGTFLDVGCGVGILLDVARKNGFDVRGVEVSTWASQYARDKGFDVTTGGLIEAAFPEKKFDVVILNHVLEHLPDPVGILQETRRILKDDGLLVVGVPNFGSYMASLKKGEWASLQPDQHIWQFTHDTIGNLMSMTGFTEVYFEAKENHQLRWWLPESIFVLPLNIFAVVMNNAEAMLIFAQKAL